MSKWGERFQSTLRKSPTAAATDFYPLSVAAETHGNTILALVHETAPSTHCRPTSAQWPAPLPAAGRSESGSIGSNERRDEMLRDDGNNWLRCGIADVVVARRCSGRWRFS